MRARPCGAWRWSAAATDTARAEKGICGGGPRAYTVTAVELYGFAGLTCSAGTPGAHEFHRTALAQSPWIASKITMPGGKHKFPNFDLMYGIFLMPLIAATNGGEGFLRLALAASGHQKLQRKPGACDSGGRWRHEQRYGLLSLMHDA